MAGINPYLYPPADPHLDGVPYVERALINHQNVNTIYPASAQLLFWGMAGAGARSVLALKLVLGAFELLTAWMVWRLAGAWRYRALAVYLLNPLVIQETWSSGHVEAAAVCMAVLAAVLLVRSRDLLAGVALGLAAGVKLTPAVLLIPAVIGRRARPLPMLAGFAAGFALPYVPYALTGAVLGSLSRTDATPRFNDAGFALLSLVLPYGAARIVAAALFVAGAVLVSRRLPGRERTAAAFAWTATLFLLLLPVVYPWYWLTAVAFGAAGQVRLPTLLGLFSPASYAGYAPFLSGRRWLMRVVAWLPLVAAGPDLQRLRNARTSEPRRPRRPSHRGRTPRPSRRSEGTAGRGPQHRCAYNEAMSDSSVTAPGDDAPLPTPASLVVMARDANGRKVKTRLAATVGPDAAAAAYATLLDSTLRQVAAASLAWGGRGHSLPSLVLALDRPAAGTYPSPGVDPGPVADRGARVDETGGWRLIPQVGTGLGERLAGVFGRLFAEGSRAVVIVGSDSPALPPEYLHEALARTTNGNETRDDVPGDLLTAGPGTGLRRGVLPVGLSRSSWLRDEVAITAVLTQTATSTTTTFADTVAAASAAGVDGRHPALLDRRRRRRRPACRRASAGCRATTGRPATARHRPSRTRHAACHPARGLPARDRPMRAPAAPTATTPGRRPNPNSPRRRGSTPSTKRCDSAPRASCSSAATRSCAPTCCGSSRASVVTTGCGPASSSTGHWTREPPATSPPSDASG